jgi:DNA repair photolyase
MTARERSTKRRGAQIDPPNRYESAHREQEFEQLCDPEDLASGERVVPTQFMPDRSQSILSENHSPDVGFRWSINPYRGCEHGCTYCFARPTHELLGMSAGIDFETKIMVKHDAPELLRRELAGDSWRPEPIMISGVTDCYQPAERRFRLTRGCLAVMLEARQPAMLVTKNALVLRDLDLLGPMAAQRLVRVAISLTTLDADLARQMEPRTSPPAERLRAIRELHAAGVPVCALIAPVVPGLTDSELPALLRAAKEAGARSAGYVLMRLPWTVLPVFFDWLERTYPLKKPRVEALLRSMRDGKFYDATWGSRMRGRGPLADQIEQVFDVFARKLGLDGSLPPLDMTRFRPPRPTAGQLRLF